MNGPEGAFAPNRGKNTNVMSLRTLRLVCPGFLPGVKIEATAIIACPASEVHRSPTLWLAACENAIGHLSKTCPNQRRGAERMRAAISAARNISPLTWSMALDATTWRGEGRPDNAFTAKMPKLITPQGQNRAAMCIMALGRDLGLSSDRAGEFGDSALFESENEEKTQQLQTALLCPQARFVVNVYNHLGNEDSETKGISLHTGEEQSRKPGRYALFRHLSYVVSQAMKPSIRTYDKFAAEVLGADWRTELFLGGDETPSPSNTAERKRVNQVYKTLSDYVQDQLGKDRGLKYTIGKGKAWETLVYAMPFKSETPIIKTVVERLYQEDQFDGGVKEGKDEGKKRVPDFNVKGDPKTEAMAAVFGLLPETQELPHVVEAIAKNGLVASTRTAVNEESIIDIMRMFSRSVARGSFIPRNEDHDEGTIGCGEPGRVEDLLPAFLDQADVHSFAADDRLLERKLMHELGDAWRILRSKLPLSREALSGINKKPILSAFGDKNKSKTVPSKGQLSEIHISTCSVSVDFDSKLAERFLSHEPKVEKEERAPAGGKKGKTRKKKSAAALEEDKAKGLNIQKARRLAIEFSMLIVQHVLRVDIGKFRVLWGALDREGMLKTTLQKTPYALDSPDVGGQNISFLDPDQVAIIGGDGAGEDPMGGEEQPEEGGADIEEGMGCEGVAASKETPVGQDNILIDLENWEKVTGRISLSDATSMDLSTRTTVTISALAMPATDSSANSNDSTNGVNATTSPTAHSRGRDGVATAPTVAGLVPEAEEAGGRRSDASKKRSLSVLGTLSSGIRQEEQENPARPAVRPKVTAASHSAGTLNFETSTHFNTPIALSAARDAMEFEKRAVAAKPPGIKEDIG
ncbi:unnamed protein product, partial [Ectocarpus sp. 8 AP-2014]